jgi:uncharacterized protein (DUF433 family)
VEKWIHGGERANTDLASQEANMTTATEHRYVVRDDAILGGEPIVRDTRTPVRAVVELWRLGVSPEEISGHLAHLTLAQVFDALSYYADHQAEIQAYLDRNQIPEALMHPAAGPNA